MLTRLINRLTRASRVLILFHESPDGDGIASSLALGYVLREKGKQVDYACKDVIPNIFHFLPGVEQIRRDFILGDYDVVCTVDCGDARRTGFPDRIKEFAQRQKRLINIDHHLQNDLRKIANINYVDEGAAASAELVYAIIEKLDGKIDKRLATLLLTGLYTDTGGFQHSNTSPRVYILAARLLAHGASLGKISKNILLSRKFATLKLWGLAMARVQHNRWGFAVSYILQEDLSELGAESDDAAGIVNIINSIPEAKVSILFVELPDNLIKASIRTESDMIDVARLAYYFGGGGHKKASGFMVDGRIRVLRGGQWTIDFAAPKE